MFSHKHFYIKSIKLKDGFEFFQLYFNTILTCHIELLVTIKILFSPYWLLMNPLSLVSYSVVTLGRGWLKPSMERNNDNDF